MTLQEAIKDIQATKRSRTFVFSCRGRELTEKLEGLKGLYGNKEMREMVG